MLPRHLIALLLLSQPYWASKFPPNLDSTSAGNLGYSNAIISANSTAGHCFDTCIPHDCSFYLDCAEANFRCGRNGYPVGYGYHFCSLFEASLDRFTPAGRTWVQTTMQCLQRSLAPYVETHASVASAGLAGGPRCLALKDYAFGTHPHCYVTSGLCRLRDFRDYFAIVEIVGVGNLLSFQGIDTGFECLRDWIGWRTGEMGP